MKKIALSTIIGILLALFIIAILDEMKDSEPTTYGHINYISTSKAKCYLCNSSNNLAITNHWGESNIGIINLNTLELLHLEINRYNAQGRLLEEVAGYMQTSHLLIEDSSVHVYVFPDSGYAHVQISGAQYKHYSELLRKNLCPSCLMTINNLNCSNAEYLEYGIISFVDRMIYPLTQDSTHLTVDSYNISCDFKENGFINLSIVLCSTQN